MIDILILAVLLDEELTIYKIKQKIKANFSVFLSASFGSIHPSTKKLEKSGFIFAKRKMSSGGQKSSFYSITAEGKKHFRELMTSEIEESPLFSNQLINIKLMLLDLLNENSRKTAIDWIKRYYQIHLLNTTELLETLEQSQTKNQNKNNFLKIKFLKNYAAKISGEIKWIQSLN